jgi:hypothetical protein
MGKVALYAGCGHSATIQPMDALAKESQPFVARAASRRRSYTWLIGGATCYSALLILAINNQSLWTDEAFSAYMASQTSFRSLLSVLSVGDPLDLLTALYYIYLYGWAHLFGFGELALRAANIPFIILFSFALVVTSLRVFKSRWIWIVAALMPFSWFHVNEARAYFVVLSLSTICFGCLLAYLESPTFAERRRLPWMILASLFIGVAFNILMVLLITPMIVIILVYRRRIGSASLADWRPALLTFALPFMLLAGFVAKVLSQGVGSEYTHPTVLSTASVLYRFVGLGGFGPNRRYDIAFGPYLLGMIVAGVGMCIAFCGMAVAGSRTKNPVRLISLSLALAIAIAQVVALSVFLNQQEDERHLAALVPLFLMVLLAALSEPPSTATVKLNFVSACLLSILWLSSDVRFLLLPEYKSQGQDFRSAIGLSIALHNRNGTDLALVADPAGGAYYGLDLQGDRPCFPLKDDCGHGFSRVDWPRKAPAVYAVGWTLPQIESWLDDHAASHRPVAVIMSLERHHMYQNSAWWTALRSRNATDLHSVSGFSIYSAR